MKFIFLVSTCSGSVEPTNNVSSKNAEKYLGSFLIPKGYTAIIYGYWSHLAIVPNNILQETNYFVGKYPQLHCKFFATSNSNVKMIDPNNKLDIILEEKPKPKKRYNVIFIMTGLQSDLYNGKKITRCESIKDAVRHMEWSHCKNWCLYRISNDNIYKVLKYNLICGYFVWDKDTLIRDFEPTIYSAEE